MTARRNGDYFERECRKALESAGWYVMRSAGSFGMYDLAALRRESRPLLVQCKTNGVMTRRALALAANQAQGVGADFVLAWRQARGVTAWAVVSPEGQRLAWYPDSQPDAS